MKLTSSLCAIAVAAILFTSCKQTASEPKTEGAANAVASTEKAAAVKPETASFSIEGMSCAIGCAKTIEKELSGMEGVQKASVDFETKKATVEFDATKLSPESFVKTVEAAADGKTYKVSNVTSSGDHAMLFDQEEVKKGDKKAKGDKTEATAKTEKKSCCSAKKHCSSDEKKA